MRWYVGVFIGVLGAAALFLVILLLPLKVSVLFTGRDGRNAVRVWIGILFGSIWIPIFRKVPDPQPDLRQDDSTSLISKGISHLQSLMRSLGGRDDEAHHGTPDGRRPRRAAGTARRVVRFFYRALRSTGLDIWRLKVRVGLGSGEAATSAIGVGVAYALISAALAAFPVPLRFPGGKPDILITPRYDRAGLDASVHCIVAVTPGYIILRGMQVRRRKRGQGPGRATGQG